MTFKEAEYAMSKIANGEAFSLQFGKLYYACGEQKTTCQIILLPQNGDGILGSGSTWDEAFNDLDSKMHPEKHIEEMPEMNA